MKKFFLSVALLFVISPGSGQQAAEVKPVQASYVLSQLGLLFTQDMTKRVPAEDTLRLTKSLVELNQMQLSYVEVKNPPAYGKSNPDETAFALSSLIPAFQDLRAAVCKERPFIRVVNLDGTVTQCQQ